MSEIRAGANPSIQHPAKLHRIKNSWGTGRLYPKCLAVMLNFHVLVFPLLKCFFAVVAINFIAVVVFYTTYLAVVVVNIAGFVAVI